MNNKFYIFISAYYFSGIIKLINIFLRISTIFTVLLIFFSTMSSFGLNNQSVFSQNEDNIITESSNFNNEPFEGYTLYGLEHSTHTYLMNNDGMVVNKWESQYIQALGTYLLENGNLIRTCSHKINPFFPFGGFSGRVEIYDWNGTLLWYFEYSTNEYCLHHDVEVLPNGNILMSAWEVKYVNESLNKGRNPELNRWPYQCPEYIFEVEPIYPSGGNIVWEWHTWDHLIQDYDQTKENYGILGEHPELIDINHVFGPEWFHINSIDYNEEFDQILLSVPGFNEIWIIDHSTTIEEAAGHTGGIYGQGGDILYRWGNPQAYDLGGPEDQIFFGLHDAQWIEKENPGEGNILIYNNGKARLDGSFYSSVEEIIPPVDENGFYQYIENQPYQPEEQLWVYNSDNSSEFYSELVSGAQRLPNGNTLICEGERGYFFEVTQNKEIVWNFSVSPLIIARNVFKIRRYPINYTGIGNIHQYNPNKPSKPDGPTEGKTSVKYTYKTNSTDPNNDKIIYLFDWGDGTTSYVGPYNSGDLVTANHVWESNGTYNIKVKAIDVDLLESLWADNLKIYINFTQVWLFGKIDNRVEENTSISFLADFLILFNLNPFNFEIYNDGAYVLVDNEYRGFITNNIIVGKFNLKSII